MTKQFATTINCIDGRVQLSVLTWITNTFNVEYVDSITEPGPVKILAEQTNTTLLASIKNRLDISINKHNSTVITIVAHYDCAGNPVSKEVQMQQMKQTLILLRQWFPQIPIHGLWVDETAVVHQLEY